MTTCYKTEQPEAPTGDSDRLEVAARMLVNVSDNRRKHPRHTLTLPCTVTPVDDDYRPTGDSFEGVTTDISCSGIGVLTSQSVLSRRVTIVIQKGENEALRLAAEVVRSGLVNGFYRTGAKITSKNQH